MSEWIPVGDRLPEVDGSKRWVVLACNSLEKWSCEAYYLKNVREWRDNRGNRLIVTHWQPLPKLPV